MPPTVAVVTDSTSYLPRGLIDRWGICEVSLYVGWDGDLELEHEYEDLDAFYARLRDNPRGCPRRPSLRWVTSWSASSRSSRRASTLPPSIWQAVFREPARAPSKRRDCLAERGHPGRGSRWLTADLAPAEAGAASSWSQPARARTRGRALDAVGGRGPPYPVKTSTSGSAWIPWNTCAAAGASGRPRRWVGTALQGQADPDLRHRDQPGRAGSDTAPGPGADGGLISMSCTEPGCYGPGSCSTARSTEDAQRPGRRGHRRFSEASPCSARRWGRCSAPISALGSSLEASRAPNTPATTTSPKREPVATATHP